MLSSFLDFPRRKKKIKEIRLIFSGPFVRVRERVKVNQCHYCTEYVDDTQDAKPMPSETSILKIVYTKNTNTVGPIIDHTIHR